MTTTNVWDQLLTRVETKVNRHSFYTWFKPAAFVDDDGVTVRVKVPNGLFRDWLTKHYSAVLEEGLAEVDRRGTVVSFVTEEGLAAAQPPPAPPPTPAAGGRQVECADVVSADASPPEPAAVLSPAAARSAASASDLAPRQAMTARTTSPTNAPATAPTARDLSSSSAAVIPERVSAAIQVHSLPLSTSNFGTSTVRPRSVRLHTTQPS